MPQTIIAVPQFTTAAPSRPLPGELAGMETGPAPLATLLQTLTDRDNFLWLQAHSLLVGSGEIEITATTIAIPPLGFAAMNVGATAWKHFAAAGFVGGLGGLAGVSNEWRFVYLYDNGGPSYGVEMSADPPDATRTWKSTGVGTHRYLCPIRASAVAGQAVPMVGRAGRWRYVNPEIVDSQTADTAERAISLAARVPTTSRRVSLIGRVQTNGSTGSYSLSVRHGAGESAIHLSVMNPGVGNQVGVVQASADAVAPGQSINCAMRFTDTTAPDPTQLFVTGFEE